MACTSELATLPRLLLLDCSGQLQQRLAIHSLQGCPHSLLTLVCCNSLVEGLAACRALQVLDVSFTEVADLGPLAGCTQLQAGLDISELRQ